MNGRGRRLAEPRPAPPGRGPAGAVQGHPLAAATVTAPARVPARPAAAGDGFGPALRDRDGGGHWLVGPDGVRRRLPVERWHGPAEPATQPVVARCAGPTLDLGCGPGRLTAALTRAGLTTVGVDVSARAVALTRARGAVAVRADLFDRLPAEGRWAHLVLLDGNVGIGGDPVALLHRCRALLRAGGTVLVEVDPPGAGAWQGRAYVLSAGHRGPAFRWAGVDATTVGEPADAAGLAVRDVFAAGRRWFAELARR
ncbi:class I SAM-dependent methyltransferase [Micromonospora siamensis]|uniref:Methyltransferase domain-containing protein n=1 Tax=Micromonospora siamensis TaxID=299152 RepID=A0A1C5IM94_9ACTN|nr:class I SAM-dependent methyltransferase [Micromonospora siamensis]SCG59458.1 Methyltransferase domain-containing protein [Micromonospora siamensis]